MLSTKEIPGSGQRYLARQRNFLLCTKIAADARPLRDPISAIRAIGHPRGRALIDTSPTSASPALELRGIVKRFPGVVANDHIDLIVERGEIRALLGENGAGKTTLMRILYGLDPPDAGEILLAGQRQSFRSPTDAIRAGLGMVHQHFMLFPSLTVAENVVYGQEPRRRGFLDRREAARRVAALAERHGLAVDPAARVADLPVGLRQRVEILKTLYREAEVLILDEPTAVLTPQESAGLFTILRHLAEQGKTIVFITHKLQEVMALADRATVLRDGRVTATVRVAESSPAELCRHMVGREVDLQARRTLPRASDTTRDEILRVEDLVVQDSSGRARVDGVRFVARSGEIVGLAGVTGNGQAELVGVLAGLLPPARGTIALLGEDITHATVEARRRAGLAYVPEDRAGTGLATGASVAENLLMGWRYHGRVARRGLLSPAGIAELGEQLVGRFAVKTPSIAEAAGRLSGGNQQKVVAARELSHELQLLIAEQPTQGVDIGAAEKIHADLLTVRQRGGAVLLISADLGELLRLADRILVLFEGRIVGEVAGEAADEATLGLLAAGGAAA
ncbi:MAG: ABC transporter ATP-binding protein [Acidobacteriota bacterium]